MIQEIAILDIIPGKNHEYEAAFKQASRIISEIEGYISHTLKKHEKPKPLSVVRVLGHIGRSYRGFSSIRRLSGMESIATPFLRSILGGRTL